MKKFIRNLRTQVRFYFLKYSVNYKIVDPNNPKTYPIIIVSFNQLFYLKQLINSLQNRNYFNIIIIDNASTYKPLLNYLKEIRDQVSVHRLKKNYGHHVFWKVKELFKLYGQSYYVITDPDIVPDEQCPENFLQYFRNILDENKEITKVGFSLKLNDIPETNPFRDKVINWESKFWKTQGEMGNFLADIDTTFALYKPGYKYNFHNFYKGIRTKEPFQAKHGGWYFDIENLTKEQKNYFATCNKSSSWGLNSEGRLKTNLYD